MTLALLAVLAALGASSARAEPSDLAQQITEARLTLVREQLPLALALPDDVPQASARKDPECPQPYKSYRDALDRFTEAVVNPMHSRKDPVAAKKEFDQDYLCAAKIAREAEPDAFQASMASKLAVAQAQLARLGPAGRRQLVEGLIAQRSLEQDRQARRRADKSVQSAVEIMKRLEDPKLASADLEALSGQVKPGAGAKRFAQDWLRNPLYASEFKPPTPAQYRKLDSQPVPMASAGAPAPVQASALASFISEVVSFPGKVGAYVQRVSAAIVNSSAAQAIDARLSAAIVWAESNFHAAAKSFANSVGLGQLSQGVAEAYHVKDREDIAQNLKGTTGFLRDLIKQFASPKDQADLQALFNERVAVVLREVAAGKPKQKAIDDEFSGLWPGIPYGMKNAVAAYNAGAPAVSRYGGWDKLPLPRGGCARRPANDSSYCQTMAYVPRVLKNYFTVYVETPQSEIFAAVPQYRPLETQSGR